MRFLRFRRHSVTEEELSAYLDSRLSGQSRERVERHVKSCVDCSRKLEEMRSLVAEMGALPETKAPRSFALSPELAAATRRERDRVRQQERASARRVYLGFGGATAAAALLLIAAVGSDVAFFSRGGATPASTGATTAQSRETTGALPQAATQNDKSLQGDTPSAEGDFGPATGSGTSPGLPPTAGAISSDGQQFANVTPPPEPLNPEGGPGLVPPATPLPGVPGAGLNPSAEATPPGESAMPLLPTNATPVEPALPATTNLKSTRAQPVEEENSHMWLWVVEGAMGGLVVGFGASAFWMRRRWVQINRS